ncbi:MAG: hypothetical protein WBA74_21830 [Cyclobacteriaceae bacterium]
MKKKNKDKPVALVKLLELKDAFVDKQSEIMDDVVLAIKRGKKNRKLKKLTKKFDKLKGKLSLLADEIQHAIDVDFSEGDKKKKPKSDKNKVKAKKADKKSDKTKKKKDKKVKLLPKEAKSLKDESNLKVSSRKSRYEKASAKNKSASKKATNNSKLPSRKPVSRKSVTKKSNESTRSKSRLPIKVSTTDGPGMKKVPVKSMDLNAKRAVSGMQDVKSVEELDKYLEGETRSTVLKRADSRRNALIDS